MAPSATSSSFPTGRVRLEGAEFLVPAGPRNAVMLWGTYAGKANLPREVKGIAIGKRAGVLLFLHVCGWSVPPAKKVGEYRVIYADGTKEEIPLVQGGNIADPTYPLPITAGRTAWEGKMADGTPVRAVCLPMEEPPRRAGDCIDRLHFVGHARIAHACWAERRQPVIRISASEEAMTMKEDVFELSLEPEWRDDARRAYSTILEMGDRIMTITEEEVGELMRGAIDMHVHAFPDPEIDTGWDQVNVAKRATDAGMGGVVFKAHTFPTVMYRPVGAARRSTSTPGRSASRRPASTAASCSTTTWAG